MGFTVQENNSPQNREKKEFRERKTVTVASKFLFVEIFDAC
jgi:hypothetical protein